MVGLCVVALFHTFNLQSYFDNLCLPIIVTPQGTSTVRKTDTPKGALDRLHSYSAKVRLLHLRSSLHYYLNILFRVCQYFFYFLFPLLVFERGSQEVIVPTLPII